MTSNLTPTKYDTLTIPGGGTILAAVHPETGKLYFSPRHVCEEIGIDHRTQFRKIKADPVMCEGVVFMPTPSGGGEQRTFLLPVEMLSGWLMSIKRLRDPRQQEALNAYRREAYAVLDAWFRRGGRQDTSSEMFAMMRETMEQMQNLHREAIDMNQAMKPKAALAEAITQDMTLFKLSTIADELGMSGIALGQRLCGWLLTGKWVGLQWRNIPTEKTLKDGFAVKVGPETGHNYRFTAKGRDLIRARYAKEAA